MSKTRRWIALGSALAAVAGCSDPQASARPQEPAAVEEPAETAAQAAAPVETEVRGETPPAAPARSADQVAADPEFEAEAKRQAQAAAAATERVLARIARCEQEIGACEASSQGLEMMQCVNTAYTGLGVWWKESGNPLEGLSSAQRSEILLTMQALESRVHGIKSQFASAR